jgi:phage-related protein
MDILKKTFYTNIDKAITIRSKNQKVYKEEDLLEIKNELRTGVGKRYSYLKKLIKFKPNNF